MDKQLVNINKLVHKYVDARGAYEDARQAYKEYSQWGRRGEQGERSAFIQILDHKEKALMRLIDSEMELAQALPEVNKWYDYDEGKVRWIYDDNAPEFYRRKRIELRLDKSTPKEEEEDDEDECLF